MVHKANFFSQTNDANIAAVTVVWSSTERLLLLILIVAAYNAECTCAPVQDRRAAAALGDHDCAVLVINDASDNSTYQSAQEYQRACNLPLTAMGNLSNQGLGRCRSSDTLLTHEGFDLVDLVHAGLQYAAEEPPVLLAPPVDGSADGVCSEAGGCLGAARRGGMALYTLSGNKMLSRSHNGSRLSGWHSGYRLYRVGSVP